MSSLNPETTQLKRTLHLDPTASDFGIDLRAGKVIYCTNCGREVQADEKFCYFCGNPLKYSSKSSVVPEYHSAAGSVVDRALQGIPDDAGHGQERAKILEQFFPKLNTFLSKNHEFNVLPNLTQMLTQKAISKFSFEYQSLIRKQMSVECLLGVYYSGFSSFFPLYTVMIFTDRCIYACANGHQYYSCFHIPYEEIGTVSVQEASLLINPVSLQGAFKLTFSPKYLNGLQLRLMFLELAK